MKIRKRYLVPLGIVIGLALGIIVLALIPRSPIVTDSPANQTNSSNITVNNSSVNQTNQTAKSPCFKQCELRIGYDELIEINSKFRVYNRTLGNLTSSHCSPCAAGELELDGASNCNKCCCTVADLRYIRVVSSVT